MSEAAMRLVEEVHRSNRTKLGSDGRPILDDNGKVMKGPHYRPPDIRRVLLEAKESRNAY